MSISEDIILSFGRDPLLAHRALFRHRHPEDTENFHNTIIDDWHSDHKRILNMMFRGGGKSTIAEEAFIVMACLQQFKNGLIIGETEPRAQERLASIKHEFETNEYILQLFGDLRGRKWQETYIELSNGTVMHAHGRGQSLRGVKHLHYRPDLALLDDLEDEESIKTPDTRQKTMDWFVKTFLPALDPRAKIRMAATPLHPEALALKLSRSPDWLVRKYPILVKDNLGEESSIWPSRYPLAWCQSKRREYESLGQMQSWMQEFMCEAENPEDKVFQSDMFRYEQLQRSWHPTYVIYDPARTTNHNSAHTGKVVGSWINNKLIIWEASGNFWKPSEIIEDIFKTDDIYSPVSIAVEKDGLEDFIMEPLRHAQVQASHLLPLKALKAPRGKEDFIKSLQPYFKAGEIIFAGAREDFSVLTSQLLSFPRGRIDVPNALAYFLKVKPGFPVYDAFAHHHIEEDINISKKYPLYLAVNATNTETSAVLLQVYNGALTIYKDYIKDGSPGLFLEDILKEASSFARSEFTVICPPRHFEMYDTIGLTSAARRLKLKLNRGGSEVKGREELRALMQRLAHGRFMIKVCKSATWTLRAFSGGYSRDSEKESGIDKKYRVLCEGIESFAATLSSQMHNDTHTNVRYSHTRDGRKYISALPDRG